MGSSSSNAITKNPYDRYLEDQERAREQEKKKKEDEEAARRYNEEMQRIAVYVRNGEIVGVADSRSIDEFRKKASDAEMLEFVNIAYVDKPEKYYSFRNKVSYFKTEFKTAASRAAGITNMDPRYNWIADAIDEEWYYMEHGMNRYKKIGSGKYERDAKMANVGRDEKNAAAVTACVCLNDAVVQLPLGTGVQTTSVSSVKSTTSVVPVTTSENTVSVVKTSTTSKKTKRSR